MQEPIEAFRSITVKIEANGPLEVTIPFDVELLERFEETLQRCQDCGWEWLRIRKGQKTILKAYEDFCKPYLPASIDLQKIYPGFCALFFSRVRDELIGSMKTSLGSTASTGT